MKQNLVKVNLEVRKTQIEERLQEIVNEEEKLEDIVKEKNIKKSSFSDFFDDYQLQTWYVNGEIKSKISYNEENWQKNFEELKKLNGKMPSTENNLLYSWCATQRKNYKKNELLEKRIKLLESLTEW